MASSQIIIRIKDDLQKLTKVNGVNGEYYNLKGANLQSADLEGVDLRGANLEGADLRGANLQDAHLQEAHLEGADLRGAELDNAHLQEAHLEGAHLEHAILISAELQGAHLEEAHLENAILIGAHLEGANLEGAYLNYAILIGVHLNEKTSLKDANLYYASFNMDYNLNTLRYRTRIYDCRDIINELTRQGMKGANFKGIHLEGAILQGAKLKHADFTGAHFEMQANFKFANLNDSVFDALVYGRVYENAIDLPTQLVEANFKGAFLQRAKFQDVNLKGANFTDAYLQGAEFVSYLENVLFCNAHLQGVKLKDSILVGAKFRGARLVNDDLVDVNLNGASMQFVDFTQLNLTFVDLRRVNCNFSDFRGGMNLSGKDFTDTRFVGAYLQEVNFTGATLINANLSRSHLRQANFQDAILEGAVFENANTSVARNLNIIRQPPIPAAVRPQEVNPFQIHQAFVPILKNIKELIGLLEKSDNTDNTDCSDFFNPDGSKFSPGIVEKLIEFCKVNGGEQFTLQNGGEPRTESIRVFLTEIIDKLRLSSYSLSGEVRDYRDQVIQGSEGYTMNKILTAVFRFVNKRSDNFKRNYLEFYIMDCMTAYPGEINPQTSISCVKGIIERFTTNIPQALADVTPEISEKDTEKSLIRINEIISDTRNIKKRLDDIGGKCNIHPENKSIENFKNCMKIEYTKSYGENGENGENNPLDPETETEINNYCDAIYQYLSGGGGKRRKTKKKKSKSLKLSPTKNTQKKFSRLSKN